MADVAAIGLREARAFMFDVDGTLLHRGSDGRGHPQPGAVEMLTRIRASGRKLVLFTNASHVPSPGVAQGLRADGLEVSDEEMLTPTDSATTWLRRHHPHARVLTFASESIQQFMADRGVRLTDRDDAEVVYVAHRQEVGLDEIETAARAVRGGAPLLTASYVAGYAGANGIIFSRGSMITAAIAKVSNARPRILGKPSRAAVDALRTRLGVAASEIAVIGDDLGMDIALGKLGGSRTVLVRSGISGAIDLDRVAPGRRPDAVVDGVSDLLELI